ncbi:MAG TPA: hypothetical protein VFS00_23990, partial [Polyangiaceae bacterium]|nr:hypothetical protein [Polyangiaceae bacterium]
APPALVEVCERALCLDPAGRFQTANDMRAAIEAELALRGWHATASDVGALVSERFRDERADFRRCIEEAFSANSVPSLSPASMSSLRALPALPVTGTPSVPSLRALQASRTPSVPSLRALRSSDPPSSPTAVSGRAFSSTGSTATSLSSTIPPPSRSPPDNIAIPPNALAPTGLSVPPPSERARASLLAWATPFIAGAMLAGLAGASFYLLRESTNFGRTSAASVGSAHAEPRPAPARPTSSALIELRIKASPAAATIFLDDQPLEGNPFRGVFPRGGKHTLRVEAKGHEAASQTLVFEQDVTEANVSLARLSPAPSAPHPSSRPHKSSNGAHDPPDEPGNGKRRRAPRSIDSELPY